MILRCLKYNKITGFTTHWVFIRKTPGIIKSSIKNFSKNLIDSQRVEEKALSKREATFGGVSELRIFKKPIHQCDFPMVRIEKKNSRPLKISVYWKSNTRIKR